MIADRVLLDVHLARLQKTLLSFFSNAPFDIRFAITLDKIFIKRIIDRKTGQLSPTVTVEIDPFSTITDSITSIRDALFNEGWYLSLVQEVSIDVMPDPMEVDALSESEDIEDAVKKASKKNIYVLRTIERVNERANQVLVSRQDKPGTLEVFIASVPIYDLLNIVKQAVREDRWEIFTRHTRLAYTVGPYKITREQP